MTENNVYKIMRDKEWEEASLNGSIISDVDKKDGSKSKTTRGRINWFEKTSCCR